MHKSLIFLWFLLFVMPSGVYSKEPRIDKKQAPPIEISFVDRVMEIILVPANKFAVALQVNDRFYYKLMWKDKIVSVGLLNKGINHLFFPTERHFFENGIHQYQFLLMKGSIIHKKVMEFDVQKEKIQQDSIKENKSETTGGISGNKKGQLTFSKNHTFNSLKKLLSPIKHDSKLAEKLIYSPIQVGTVSPLTGFYEPPAIKSPFGIVSLAYLILHSIKEFKKSRTKREAIKKTYGEITVIVFRKNEEEDKIQTNTIIKIRIKNQVSETK